MEEQERRPYLVRIREYYEHPELIYVLAVDEDEALDRAIDVLNKDQPGVSIHSSDRRIFFRHDISQKPRIAYTYNDRFGTRFDENGFPNNLLGGVPEITLFDSLIDQRIV